MTAPETLTATDCPYSEWYLKFMVSNETNRGCRLLPVRGFGQFSFSKNLTFDPENSILQFWYFQVKFCLYEPDKQKKNSNYSSNCVSDSRCPIRSIWSLIGQFIISFSVINPELFFLKCKICHLLTSQPMKRIFIKILKS